MKICVIFLNDVIIFSDSYEVHLKRCNYFQQLRECSMKLNAKKYEIFEKQVKYVGFIVSADFYISRQSIECVRLASIVISGRSATVLLEFQNFSGDSPRILERFKKILTTIKQTRQRWVSALSAFYFEIPYKKEK